MIVRDQLIRLLALAGMELGKWASNCPAILSGIQAEKQKHHSVNWDQAVSTLGLKWVPLKDVFRFEVNLPSAPKVVTKNPFFQRMVA